MEETDPDKDSNNEMTPSNSSSQPKRTSHQCKICGAPAIQSNYGAVTCSPCKMFFKRNVKIDQKYLTCVGNGQCEINVHNRHICSSCRLAKCYANGMQPHLIRCPLTKRNVTNQNINMTPTTNILMRTPPQQQNQLQLFPIINLLQSDTSILTTDQWTLLSNLIYSYDESKLLLIAQQIVNQQNDDTVINQTLVNDFFMKVYETCGTYIRSNGDLSTLPSGDRSAFLRNTANHVIWLGGTLCWHLSQLYNCKYFIDVCKSIYGENSVKLVEQVLRYIDSDIVISKLALSLFAFCNNVSMHYPNVVTEHLNTLAILRIQNTYVEVLWRYVIYKYGYYESVQRFVKLIQYLLAATNAIHDAQNIEKHVSDTEALIEQTELALVLDDVEQIEEDKN